MDGIHSGEGSTKDSDTYTRGGGGEDDIDTEGGGEEDGFDTEDGFDQWRYYGGRRGRTPHQTGVH